MTTAQKDVLFQDGNACVLDPNCNRGVLISSYHPTKGGSLARDGQLMSLNECHDRGIPTIRKRAYFGDYIFFRPRQLKTTPGGVVFTIRVDPDLTYVYDQENHSKRGSSAIENEDRISLTKYLSMVSGCYLEEEGRKGYLYWPNLSTCSFHAYPISGLHLDNDGGYTNINKHLMFEVRIQSRVIPVEWLHGSSDAIRSSS